LGWRGFALPRLLERYRPLKAGIILGVIWDFWHLPLWITSGYASVNLLLYFLYFSIGIISLSVLMTWIYHRTSYSLVPMVIAHFSFNTGLDLFGSQGLKLAPTLPLLGLIATLCLVTVVVVWATGGLRTEPNS
jgi:membrane protease YdiL (CAAX protease family)